MNMTVDDRRTRALRWLDVIRGDVRDLLIANEIFWQLQEVWKANSTLERLSGVFPRFIVNSHINSMAVGIRKQAKGRTNRDVSLYGLLQEVQKFPEVVSREHYLSFFEDAEDWLRDSAGDGYFDTLAGAAARTLPVALIESHISELKCAAERIEHLADKRIAHYAEGDLKQPMPTFADVKQVLAVFDRHVVLYLKLLTGSAPSTLLRPIDPGRLRRIVRKPRVFRRRSAQIMLIGQTDRTSEGLAHEAPARATTRDPDSRALPSGYDIIPTP